MARKEYMVVDVVDILRRLQNGYSIRAVTRATGMDRNTLRKYLRLAYCRGPWYIPTKRPLGPR